MKGFKDSTKKFHPIKKSVRYKKSGRGKSIIPKLELKLPERKESFSEINADITRDANLRNDLIDKSDTLADKIELNPQSEFTESRKDQIKENRKVVKDLNSDIKRSLSKLTSDEKKSLPDEVKNLRRFL